MRTPARLIGAALLIGATVLGAGPAALAGPQPAPPAAHHTVAVRAAQATASGDGLTEARTVTRERYAPGASTPTTISRDVTVRIDRHTDLQARERIHVSWDGAQPTGGRVGNPYGESGLDQEYPVAIFECRGLDDPSLPAAQQISPDTCWTNTTQERSQSDDADRALWRQDLYASDADRQLVSGVDPSTIPDNCPTRQDGTAYHYTPFLSADGTVNYACDSAHMAPEAAVGAVDPPNETFAYTDETGHGTADFEVRTDTENASMGCSHTVPCSLVVIPIMGISCTTNAVYCNRTGAYAPGSANDGTTGAQAAVSPGLWWSESNWRNRLSFPLQFALPPSTCQLLGQGPPVPFYGSELLGQAALQWLPAYCLNKQRFNWQSNTMPDDAAFQLMSSGGAIAANVTARGADDKGIGYAPTAVSGFGIAFDIDDPDSGLPRTELKLNARLLAKLLTMSYPADSYGAERPGLGDNPLSLQTDPEFLKLNPGLDLPFGRTSSQAAATLLSLSTSSGVIEQLTSYIAHDPAAMAFVDGKADPWGMKVNPAYKGLKLPVDSWPLLDPWLPKNTGNSCLDANQAPYLAKIAAPVSDLGLISQAMLFNWPLVQTACELDPTTGIYKLGRVPRQNIGQRFMLGLVTLGDAARFGLPVAALQAAPGHYVAPDDAGLAAGLKVAKKSGPGKPWVIDQARVRRSSSAYPGTSVVYTAARTGKLITRQDGAVVSTVAGLDAASADDVAQFIDVSSTEGQVRGRGNGKLPDGFLPLTRNGVTAGLFQQARMVAAQVRAQKPVVVTLPSTAAPGDQPGGDTGSTGGDGGVGDTGGTGDVGGTQDAPGGDTPSSAPSKGGDVAASTTEATQPVAAMTPDLHSGLGGRLLPWLVLLGLVAGVAAGVGRVVVWRSTRS